MGPVHGKHGWGRTRSGSAAYLDDMTGGGAGHGQQLPKSRDTTEGLGVRGIS